MRKMAINMVTPVLLRRVQRLWSDEEGATALEYGLLAACIAAGIALAVSLLGTEVNSSYESTAQTMETVTP